ncbi:MAG TPA: host attachment protein [Gammaproteobacteria bacterium]|nr:host attachment protein [Gammaproteobacteria bacterium]
MSRECVVVAEQGRARFFIRDTGKKTFTEIDDLTNPDARLQDQELESDRPGRAFDSRGSNRHAMEPKTGISEQSATRFAKKIRDYLENNRREYDNIILIASPAFLGHLRKELPDTLSKMVKREIDKEIVRKKTDEIREYLKL